MRCRERRPKFILPAGMIMKYVVRSLLMLSWTLLVMPAWRWSHWTALWTTIQPLGLWTWTILIIVILPLKCCIRSITFCFIEYSSTSHLHVERGCGDEDLLAALINVICATRRSFVVIIKLSVRAMLSIPLMFLQKTIHLIIQRTIHSIIFATVITRVAVSRAWSGGTSQ